MWEDADLRQLEEDRALRSYEYRTFSLGRDEMSGNHQRLPVLPSYEMVESISTYLMTAMLTGAVPVASYLTDMADFWVITMVDRREWNIV
jgi:hypothetical protein